MMTVPSLREQWDSFIRDLFRTYTLKEITHVVSMQAIINTLGERKKEKKNILQY